MAVSKEYLEHHYLVLGKPDTEIARAIGRTRTSIVKLRKKYEIPTRLYSGRTGEMLILSKLKAIGKEVIDMNKEDKTSPFDILLEGKRIEIKTAKKHAGRYRFQLSNKPQCKIRNANRTKTGRTVKSYKKTCDFFIFVCLDDQEFYIIPSHHLKDDQITVCITLGGKYETYRNRWKLVA